MQELAELFPTSENLVQLAAVAHYNLQVSRVQRRTLATHPASARSASFYSQTAFAELCAACVSLTQPGSPPSSAEL